MGMTDVACFAATTDEVPSVTGAFRFNTPSVGCEVRGAAFLKKYVRKAYFAHYKRTELLN
jgi:hypothetical protein